ncbi:MAG TPA: S9 family peptidase [Myxococcota bacterium]|nr:S9 family peptidase [Myxococcota bacterium]
MTLSLFLFSFSQARADDIPLIPREVLFGNPDRVQPRVSPDGEHLAFLAPHQDVLNVWVAPLDELSAATPLTSVTERPIRSFSWAETSEHVLYSLDSGGDEDFHVFSQAIVGGPALDLSPYDDVTAFIQQTSPDDPTHVLIGMNDRKARLHDLYLVDITSAERVRVEKNKGYLGFVTDDAFNVRLATKFRLDGGIETFVKNDKGKWESYDVVGMEDSLTTQHLGFDREGTTLYSIDSRDRGTAALYATDLATGERSLLHEDDRADISDAMVNPSTYVIEAVAVTYEKTEWTVLDEGIAGDLAFLDRVDDGELEVVSRSSTDEDWIVAFTDDDGPVQYWHYDRAEGHTRYLFSNRSELDTLQLAPMHPLVIEARDGLELVSYLTLPVGTDADGDGVPETSLPMVLLVHGGPWARDHWGYHSYHQWLANRGYAVLSVNFRGSTGLGKDHLNAGNLEWAGKMHDDLIDAVDWAVEEGIATEDEVAIMGGSYGGYATLVGLTFTPEVFACGVDIVGPSNIVTLLETIPPYWKPAIELFAKRVGDHRTKEGEAFLQQRSPLTHVDEIVRPLLIAQGANDPRVKQSESDQIVEAMQARDIPVTYVLYPDEGHGFANEPNRISFAAVSEAFLAEHLGGRSEPIGDAFGESSITVPAGAELVPGVSEALPSPEESE